MKWRKPTEASEQRKVIQWSRFARCTEPDLDYLIHVPNEGRRTPRAGAELKRQGLSPGFPDLFLFVARGGYHGLAIELKTTTGKLTEPQERWLAALADKGFLAVCCRGSEEAIDTILRYLRKEDSHDTHAHGQGTGSATPPACA